MCSIAGFWWQPARASDELRAVAQSMADAITQRGPDSHGTWVDPDHGMRLGIVGGMDLSAPLWDVLTIQSWYASR